MTKVAHVVGIDPGLVHTGCIRMVFLLDRQIIRLMHEVVTGLDSAAVAAWVKDSYPPAPHVFIEAYRPRHNLSPDTRMVAGVAELKQALPGSIALPNTGVTRVVPTQLMALLGVWDWPQSTHHQDLRSAARIALLGMMKDATLNRVLSATVRDHLAGRTWEVTRP
jgi:hypothetical protein